MKKDNNKIKKIGAWIAIIILLLACCMPMIFAFGNGEDSQAYFKASLAVAIMVPIMAYAIWMVYKLLNRNKKVVDSDMENIIFDVGQVLVKYDWETYLDSFGFPKEERDKIAEVVFQSNTWNERDRSSEIEQYYVDQMVKAAPEYEKDIREVMRRSDETIDFPRRAPSCCWEATTRAPTLRRSWRPPTPMRARSCASAMRASD